MELTTSNIVHYLLGCGLVTLESVVDGDFLVVSTPRRNQNFKVLRGNSAGFFVKQIQNWDPQTIASMQCEATCYWLARNDPDFAPLASLLPGFYAFDSGRHILVLELLPNGESLTEYHHRLGRFPTEVATQLGNALGTYHRQVGTKMVSAPPNTAFQKKIPWVLSVHKQSIEMFNPVSAANSQLLNIVRQYPEFQAALDTLRENWKATSLIHGDIKWDNCVIYSQKSGNGEERLKIVDWEMADIGDPYWDVGSIIQGYLTSWIMSMPVSVDAPPSQLVEKAQFPLEHMQPAIRAFWDSYILTREVDDTVARELLELSVKYAAARMIQTAYEYMYYSPQLNASIVYLLQVSMNILESPKDAIAHLLEM